MTDCRCTLDPKTLVERTTTFSQILSVVPAESELLPGGRWRMTLDLPAETHARLVALVAAERSAARGWS